MNVFFLVLCLLSPVAGMDSFPSQGQGTWVRVGLGRPDSQPLFFYKGKLQILDGPEVVQELESHGRFWIIRESDSKARYCLRITSGPSARLQKDLNHLRREMKSLSFHVIKHKGRKYAFLETGSLSSKGMAQKVMKKIRLLGYPKTSLIKLSNGKSSNYILVDRSFHRHKLGNLKRPGLKPGNRNGVLTFGGKEYRGVLYLKWMGAAFRVINFLPLEVYLRGVVPGEMGPKVYPRLEALKAQAVAARTYTLRNLGKFDSQGFDICDTPRCQVYSGVQVEDELSDRAISETKGEVLIYEGKLADALYTSTCGGFTDPVDHVFPRRKGTPEPYLAGASSYLEKNSGWTMTLPVNAMLKNRTDLQIRAWLLGIKDVDIDGMCQTDRFKSRLEDLKGILGEPEDWIESETWTGREVLKQISGIPFIHRSAGHQCTPQDVERFAKYSGLDIPVEWFFMTRYGALNESDLVNTDMPWSAEKVLDVLVRIAEVFGPGTSWKTYRVDHLTQDALVLRNWEGELIYPLSKLELVLTRRGDDWAVPEKIYFQMWDKVALPNDSMERGVVYLKPSGWSASVDRSSSYSSWIVKENVDEIEKLTRKYISKVRGIKDLKIISQAESGRVTELEVIADSGSFRVTGLTIRRILGIRDNLFEFLPQYSKGRLSTVTFVGKGWGHGVGMSQVGAFGLALEGWSYRQILKLYYKDVEIVQASSLVKEK